MNKDNIYSNKNYIVCMVRKSDNKFYFSCPNNGSQPKVYTYKDAFIDANRRASSLSKDYKYVVVELKNICEVEATLSPVVVTYL